MSYPTDNTDNIPTTSPPTKPSQAQHLKPRRKPTTASSGRPRPSQDLVVARLLTPGKAAHDARPAEEPQEADEADEGEAGGGKEQELEEPGRACSSSLLEKNGESAFRVVYSQNLEDGEGICLPRCQTS